MYFFLLPGLVPLETTGEDLLGGVDALLALAALGYFGGLEGHLLENLVRSWGFEVSGTGEKIAPELEREKRNFTGEQFRSTKALLTVILDSKLRALTTESKQAKLWWRWCC